MAKNLGLSLKIANVLSAHKVDTEGIAKLGVDYIYVLKVILQEENKPITILRQNFWTLVSTYLQGCIVVVVGIAEKWESGVRAETPEASVAGGWRWPDSCSPWPQVEAASSTGSSGIHTRGGGGVNRPVLGKSGMHFHPI